MIRKPADRVKFLNWSEPEADSSYRMVHRGLSLKKLPLLIFVLIISNVKAKLIGFPDDTIQLGYQPNKSIAVWHLFDGKAKDIRELSFDRKTSAQHDTIFSVKFAGKDWFVKIVYVDLEDEEPLHFEYEWELKAQKEKYAALKKVNGKIVFADRAAFFTTGGDLYYVASYPFVPGKTIDSVVEQYIEAEQSTDSAVFYKALYRYAQVSALLHYNPDDIPSPGEDILERPVQIYLEDRNGFNELYDAAQDTIYLIDYPLDHENYQLDIPVKNYLHEFIQLFDEFVGEEVCGVGNTCLPIIINTFIKGYADALPKYGYDLLNRTIWNYLVAITEKGCNGELVNNSSNDESLEDYCETNKVLQQIMPAFKN